MFHPVALVVAGVDVFLIHCRLDVAGLTARPSDAHEVTVEKTQNVAVAAALVLEELREESKVRLPRRQTPQALRPSGVEELDHERPGIRSSGWGHTKLISNVSYPLRVRQAQQEHKKR
eukprot:106231-Rhodomonas_salina.1